MPKKALPEPVLPDVSEDTLAEVPARALKLLLAIGTSVPIRAAMATRGYDKDEHIHGWSLLHAVAGYAPAVAEAELSSDNAEAIRALDAWDEDGFALVRASWEHRFPELLAFVLRGGLRAGKGAESVLAVKTLLDRLDALDKGDERKGSREADHAALALLAKRGIDAKERVRLRDLVTRAQGFSPVAPASDETAHQDDTQKRRALYAWVTEWSQIARTAIKRRDYLVRMGLARPKSRKKGDDQGDDKKG